MLERKLTASQPDITHWLGSALEVLIQLEAQPASHAASVPTLMEHVAVIAVQSPVMVSI